MSRVIIKKACEQAFSASTVPVDVRVGFLIEMPVPTRTDAILRPNGNVILAVNAELIGPYWRMGRDILARQVSLYCCNG